MKKANKLKWFSLGIATCLIVSTLVIPALAATITTKNAQLEYSGMKITLNGSAVTPKDVNGNTVDPFVINGTTYLPVRALASALGLNVDWDKNTNTVALSSSTATQTGTILYDANGIKISYTGISRDTYGSLKVKLYIENSSSKKYTVQARNTSINGTMIDPIFSCDIMPGKNAYDGLSLYESQLSAKNITAINSIEGNFIIVNADNWQDGITTPAYTINCN